MANKFKDDLKVQQEQPIQDKRAKMEEQYEALTSTESIEYVKKILLTMGQELETMYPHMGFLLKARVKSKDSFVGKTDRKDKIYDTIGFCLVIESVPDSIVDYLDKKDDAGIIEELKEAITKKKDIELDKLERENQLNREITVWRKKLEELDKELEVLSSDSKIAQIVGLQKGMCNDMLKKIELDKTEILTGYDKQIETVKEEMRRIMAKYTLNKVLDSDAMKKDLGISKIPGRSKKHDGGKTGYYHASHEGVQSSIIDGWIGEMQSLSLGYYNESRRGLAAHWRCQGKERKFPTPIAPISQLVEMPEQKEKFKKEVLDQTPKNMVYRLSTKNPDGSDNPGEVLIFSDMADITYHFWNVLKERPTLLEFIQDDRIFDDQSDTFPESQR